MKQTIVIVDDNDAIVDILKMCLANQGYGDVHGFCDPFEALMFLKDHRVYLLVTDFKMPGMTGLELIDAAPKIPNIILTSCSFPEDRQLKRECRKRGAIPMEKAALFKLLPSGLRQSADIPEEGNLSPAS